MAFEHLEWKNNTEYVIIIFILIECCIDKILDMLG